MVSEIVKAAAAECERHMLEMANLFRPRCKLTFLMRDPTTDEGDLLLTDDSLDEILKAIERSKAREAVEPIASARGDAEAQRRENWTPFENDPWAIIVEAFGKLWPNLPLPIIRWVPDLCQKDGDPLGQTFIPDDDGVIVVSLDIGTSVRGTIEILAHELAHVACEHLGIEDSPDHGPNWEACFAKIHETYNAIVDELTAEDAKDAEEFPR